MDKINTRMEKIKIILKNIRFPFLLVFTDVFLLGQGLIAILIFIITTLYLLPRTILSFKNKERLKKNLKILLIYSATAFVIFFAIRLDNILAMKKAGIVINALENYRLKYASYPQRLEELVPEFLLSIPRSKINLLYNKFSYIGSENGHTLLYVVFPPFGRNCYKLETKEWYNLD